MISKRRVHAIAVIPGDGIGIEVTAATLEILRRLEEDSGIFQLQFTEFDWSSESYLRHGYYIPEDGLASLASPDAILLGAVGSPGTIFPATGPPRVRIYSRFWLKQTCPIMFRCGVC